jgi:hypothetical protein
MLLSKVLVQAPVRMMAKLGDKERGEEKNFFNKTDGK